MHHPEVFPKASFAAPTKIKVDLWSDLTVVYTYVLYTHAFIINKSPTKTEHLQSWKANMDFLSEKGLLFFTRYPGETASGLREQMNIWDFLFP